MLGKSQRLAVLKCLFSIFNLTSGPGLSMILNEAQRKPESALVVFELAKRETC